MPLPIVDAIKNGNDALCSMPGPLTTERTFLRLDLGVQIVSGAHCEEICEHSIRMFAMHPMVVPATRAKLPRQCGRISVVSIDDPLRQSVGPAH